MRLHLFTPDAQYTDNDEIERKTAGPDVDWTICRERDLDRLPVDALARADGIVSWHEMPIDAAFIAKVPKCRVIVRAGVGFDHIDLEAAGRVGIPVCNTPDYGTSEVADHAIALMLALTCGIVCFHENLVRDPVGGFDSSRAPLVRRLRGRTFGVVGFGRIGTATALRAKAFGFRVVGYDPYASAGTEIAIGIERLDALEDLPRPRQSGDRWSTASRLWGQAPDGPSNGVARPMVGVRAKSARRPLIAIRTFRDLIGTSTLPRRGLLSMLVAAA